MNKTIETVDDLVDLLDELWDVQLIDNTPDEANVARDEIESIITRHFEKLIRENLFLAGRVEYLESEGRSSYPSQGDEPKGLYHKYIVQKADGTLVDPSAQYFVLRIDTDVHARVALAAYADSVADSNLEFASDLRHWVAAANGE